ncbi:MAG: NAD(+) synthase [Gammaproteobacteria bacterium]|nr:NAD(+) synthase [Gammaproteobacteria bacterium]MBT8152077.1 NAD(+) synthase [Gammaproteobacteria bacterium]NNM10342.1 NAD(+) synthase [Pseudomonadales bacterium]RZV54244.1 MAG: NAD(+) synthase [Pseudomonadales bacterium]
MDYADLGYRRVAVASPVVSIGNPEANTKEIIHQAKLWADDHVTVGLFPELCLSGYSAEDLFFSETLITRAIEGLVDLCANNPLPLLVVGSPWRLADGRLLNCAVAIGAGRVLGMVPKSVLPNYGEFYDLRWFASGADVNQTISHPGLGTFDVRVDQLFDLAGCLVGMEICEDLWAPHAPSTNSALAGAEIILNLSASNELIAKAEYRRNLVSMASAKNICAYAYSSAGATESSKDVVYGGHCFIAENGQLLGETPRFGLAAHSLICDIDSAYLRHDRSQNTTFAKSSRPNPYQRILASNELPPLQALMRQYDAFPFVPEDADELSSRAAEILQIQATGLARRMRAAKIEKLVIGLSGGLDSTLAFLVCLDALELLSLGPEHLVALTMPGPGTSSHTKKNAFGLARAALVQLQEIPINAAVKQHLQDLKHNGEHDVVFENAQARERTQLLFNYANKVNGLVVGTGDLSELALGWCTFNADQMANYNVNASVPKTLIRYLVDWYSRHRASPSMVKILTSVLDTPVSPELIPADADNIGQLTEAIIGPYELHDFFLFHYLRHGASPTKIFHLGRLCFAQYDDATIVHWLHKFFQRFFTQQFKRTTLPPGPKVGSVSLSPRGDWRMPDEASVEPYLKEIEQLL